MDEDEKRDKWAAMAARRDAVEGQLRMETTELGLEVQVTELLAERGIYDSLRLRERKPELFKACQKMLLRGVSAAEVADLLGLDIRTVNPVKDELEAQGAITPFKKSFAASLRAVLAIAVDQLMQQAKDGKLTSIDVGILCDKLAMLEGGVTSRVEVRLSRDDEESIQFYDRIISRAKELEMVLEAEILPQTAALGSPSVVATELQQSAGEGDQGPVRPQEETLEPRK